MAINLNSVIDMIRNKYKLQMVTGNNSMKEIVKWIYYTEDINTLDFIRGGEIVITTGMKCKSNEWMRQLIAEADKYNAAAIVINVGQYINEIPDEIVEFANAMDMPLFTMPWNMHIVDLTQDICNILLLDKQKEFDEKKVFSDFFFRGEEVDKELLEERGLYFNKKYLIIKLVNNDNMKNDFWSSLETEISQKIERYLVYSVMVSKKENAYMFLQLVDDNMDIFEKIELILNRYKIVVGVSNIHNGEYNIQEGKREADEALQVAVIKNINAIRYEDIGIYQLLLQIDNSDFMNSFSEKYLKIFDRFGEEKEIYINTFKNYIDCDGSIQKIAQKEFVHRNTVNYRIRKLKDLMPEYFENEEKKMLMRISFFIRDMGRK